MTEYDNVAQANIREEEDPDSWWCLKNIEPEPVEFAKDDDQHHCNEGKKKKNVVVGNKYSCQSFENRFYTTGSDLSQNHSSASTPQRQEQEDQHSESSFSYPAVPSSSTSTKRSSSTTTTGRSSRTPPLLLETNPFNYPLYCHHDHHTTSAYNTLNENEHKTTTTSSSSSTYDCDDEDEEQHHHECDTSAGIPPTVHPTADIFCSSIQHHQQCWGEQCSPPQYAAASCSRRRTSSPSPPSELVTNKRKSMCQNYRRMSNSGGVLVRISNEDNKFEASRTPKNLALLLSINATGGGDSGGVKIIPSSSTSSSTNPCCPHQERIDLLHPGHYSFCDDFIGYTHCRFNLCVQNSINSRRALKRFRKQKRRLLKGQYWR